MCIPEEIQAGRFRSVGEEYRNSMEDYYSRVDYYLQRATMEDDRRTGRYIPIMCKNLRTSLSEIIGPFAGLV